MGFYNILSDYYDQIFPLNQQQAQFISERAGTNILDVAAGSGSLALALAEQGYTVTATDLEPNMTKQIKRKKEQAQVELEIRTMDMRQLDQLPSGAFDTIICLGNSLVHLASEGEVADVLEKAFNLLSERGRLIIQIVNYDRIIADRVQALPPIEREQVQFYRTYEWKAAKLLFQGRLIVTGDDGQYRTFEQTTELLPLKKDALGRLLETSGFQQIEWYGNFKAEAYQLNSPAMIAVAQR
ncbi:hypothetical protein BEP19_14450 [Ammoniphilus oxalaticus]|uniref:Methyltransferase domain-containing protein n=1 Tax=Ammoniphilus oxalaticus TaxID=66863 RepID=A0A419SER6_9BACL|nr:class I SAM-dependent methyltransferase [Ammoniphilus oxalaticus]RKD21812.1 hypothetical protein BEP19_14450 [Ammoniphilus oxalaticus]